MQDDGAFEKLLTLGQQTVAAYLNGSASWVETQERLRVFYSVETGWPSVPAGLVEMLTAIGKKYGPIAPGELDGLTGAEQQAHILSCSTHLLMDDPDFFYAPATTDRQMRLMSNAQVERILERRREREDTAVEA